MSGYASLGTPRFPEGPVGVCERGCAWSCEGRRGCTVQAGPTDDSSSKPQVLPPP